MEETPNYYAIIPANVRYDNELRANEKLLYGEISALANKNGECWASNDYFAKLYGKSKDTVSDWISRLSKKGYIKVELLHDENKVIKRKIFLSTKRVNAKVGLPINENDTDEVSAKIPIGYRQKCLEGIGKNTEYNNTSINNNICSSLAEDFDKLWKIYPRKDGKNQAFNHYKAWINGKSYAGKIEKLTNPEMWYAIRIYQCNIKINKTEKQYIKMGSTFFNEAIYEYASYYKENPQGWEKKIKEILESE